MLVTAIERSCSVSITSLYTNASASKKGTEIYNSENTNPLSSTCADGIIPRTSPVPYSQGINFNVLFLASRLSISLLLGSRRGVTIVLPIIIEIPIWGAPRSPVSWDVGFIFV